jgi:hypothetical protein
MIYEENSRAFLGAFLTNYSKYLDFFKKLSEKETKEYLRAMESCFGKERLEEMSKIFFSCRTSYETFLSQVEKENDDMIIKFVENNRERITFN